MGRCLAGVAIGLAWLLACCAGGEPTPPAPPALGPPARLEVFASDSAVLAGHDLQLEVAAWDSLGRRLTHAEVVWRTLYPGWLPVDSSAGTVHAAPDAPSSRYPIWAVARETSVADTLDVHVARHGEVKWRLPIGTAPLVGGPAQGPDGTIYVLGDCYIIEATLYAVSPRGTVLWTRHLDQVGKFNYPIVGPDGSIYVVGQYVWAFDPDGTLRWSMLTRPLEFPLPNLPGGHAAAVSADGILYAAMGYDLFALRGSNGDTLWVGPRAPDAGWLVPPTVSVDRRTVYIKNTGTATMAFDATTGSQRWTVADPHPNFPVIGVGPTLFGARLLAPSEGRLQELDTSGQVVGVTPSIGGGMSEPAIGPDGTLYVVHPQNIGIEAFQDISTSLWQQYGFRSWKREYGGPALAGGGILYVAGMEGFLALQLGGSGATLRWRFPRPAGNSIAFTGAPLIGPDGTVYSFTACDDYPAPCSGELFAFWEDKLVEPNSPWPMWRHDARRSGQAHR
jgi:outer membrane protein assembly factor BamB